MSFPLTRADIKPVFAECVLLARHNKRTHLLAAVLITGVVFYSLLDGHLLSPNLIHAPVEMTSLAHSSLKASASSSGQGAVPSIFFGMYINKRYSRQVFVNCHQVISLGRDSGKRFAKKSSNEISLVLPEPHTSILPTLQTRVFFLPFSFLPAQNFVDLS
jgi:hypothetical protein